MDQSEYEKLEAMANAHAESAQNIRVPPLHPYGSLPTCEKCGQGLRTMGTILGRVLSVFGVSAQTYGYCQGDLNSTVNVEIHLPFADAVKSTMPTTCFGVFVPHLHLKCGRCGYWWLMETRTK